MKKEVVSVSPKSGAIAIAIFWMWMIGECVPDTTISEVLCNNNVYTSGDPFAISLAYVLQEIETATSTHHYNYYNISPYPDAFAYAHATCNTNLTPSDCNTCLTAAKSALLAMCPARIGARSLLHDCTISLLVIPPMPSIENQHICTPPMEEEAANEETSDQEEANYAHRKLKRAITLELLQHVQVDHRVARVLRS
ncbi:antifungal protein ginkbilobin-like protein [Senna tora]|uniref:Antifungal protein ginkbilobin-like protein n=1 Tax=Senna tora TaxID=362788 RepID=A0A834TIX0_9FABA|nr:antifungal protein ginkbilobin-like protein [Senna tora]